MPSPSAARHRGSIIRQFSLQNQPSTPAVAGRRGFKKQLSEDETRSKGAKDLDSVEVTGQGWSTNGERGEASKSATTKTATVSRPKPVKLAWADRKQDSTECPTGVEVVARKCQGQPRPLTVKSQRITNLLGEKDSLVFTKQQLAERLRIAWREREKRKANLNIFLARPVESDRNGFEEVDTARSSEMRQAEIIIQDSISFRSVSGSESSLPCESERVYETETVRGVSGGAGATEEVLGTANDFATESSPEDVRAWSAETEEERGAVTDSPDFKTFPIADSSSAFGLTNLNRRMKSLDLPSEEELRGKENSPRSDSGFSEQSKIGKVDEAEEEAPRVALEVPGEGEKRAQGTAQERRASFRSGSLLNKTIDESYLSPESSESSEEGEDDTYHDNSNEIKVFLKKNNEKRPPLLRTLSAPTRNDFHSQKMVAHSAPIKTVAKILPHYASSMDLGAVEEDFASLKGRAKSAPIRRKLKPAASRRKHREKDQDSSDDERTFRESSKKKSSSASSSRRRATSRMGGADIVTMVSLVSPATSDTEESVIPIPEETWTAEEKAEGAVAASASDGRAQKSCEPPREVSSFFIQKFVSLRKTTKTVSFVQHPPINRSYSASFPSRRAPAGTPIIIPTPVITNPALTPAQLQEREKRPPPPLSANGSDGRGIKRKLVRTASAPQVKGSSEEAGSAVERPRSEQRKKEFETIEESNEGEEARKEPEFKSPKEKECWLLYQKMLEKGVSVSFDTVLRGMLTPTEYRLRRNQLLSSC